MKWLEVLDFKWFDLGKVVLTAVIIVLVTKVQVYNAKLAALLVALPLTSLLAMLWMRVENREIDKIATHAESTFWFVLPTLPMFLVLPWMLRNGWGFGLALFANCLLTVVLFWVLVWVGRRVGVEFY